VFVPRFGRAGLSALALALALAGCSSPDQTPPGEQYFGPPGPPLTGQLLVQTTDHTVWALRQSGGQITASRIVSAAGDAALSPDGKTLAYIGGSGIVFRDLATGAERQPYVAGQIVGDYGDCLAWSPDSQRLLFLADGGTLYTATLDGVDTVVDQPQRATYVLTNPLAPPPLLPPFPGLPGFPQSQPTGPRFVAHSQVTCGSWLDANRVVFDRLTGAMPETLASPNPTISQAPVPADTTTVAVLSGGSVALTDSANRWKLAGTCGSQLLTSRASGDEEIGGQGTDSALYLVNGLPTAAVAQPNGATPDSAQVPHPSNGTMAMFIRGSCALLVVDLTVNSQNSYDAFRLSSAAHTLTPAKPLWGFQFFHPGGEFWAPGPDPSVFADFVQGQDNVKLVDISTGGITTLKLPDPQAPDKLRALVGWLP
jgi:hypothetical protein